MADTNPMSGAAQGAAAGSAFGPWGTAIGAGIGFLGGLFTNDSNQKQTQASNNFNAQQAAIQRDWSTGEAITNRNFQAEMRATQYQTAVNDMKSAGLNPMLAYSQGGAGNLAGAMPSGSSASASPNIPNQNPIQGAMQSAQQIATIANTDANTELLHAKVNQTNAETSNTTANEAYTRTNDEYRKQEMKGIPVRIQETWERANYIGKQAITEHFRVETEIAKKELIEIQQRLAKSQITQTEAQTELTKINAKLNSLDISGKEAENKVNESTYGQRVRPLLRDVGQLTNSAASIGRMTR